MSTLDELQHELESVAPPPPSAAKLRRIAGQRRRRRLATYSTVGVVAVAAFGLGVSQLQSTTQVVDTAGEVADPNEGVPVPSNEEQPPTTSDDITTCPEGEASTTGDGTFVGLQEADAIAAAEYDELTPIVECRDGVSLITVRPSNYDRSRLWLTVTDGVVTKTSRG